jgi:SAM-dependent methyltransferase
MTERLYTEYPELYDAIQSDWDYEQDISFLLGVLEHHAVAGGRLLEIGCGTGEHTRRLVDEGFEVTALDKHEGMLSIARDKCDAEFRREALPDLSLKDTFDVAVAIRGVVNHLSPDELSPAIEVVASRLGHGGVFVFDNSPLPPDGTGVGLDVGTTEHGDYARLAQHVPTGNGQLDWRSVLFGPEGEFFVNSRAMTPFEDQTVRSILEDAGFVVETHDGYGPDDERTVFVAVCKRELK